MTTTQKQKSTHTPGPWQINKLKGGVSFNIRGGQDSVAAVYAFVGSPVLNDRVYEGEANARLIAAAPELLEAMKSLVAGMREDIASDFTKSLIKQAKEAISKAEGRTE